MTRAPLKDFTISRKTRSHDGVRSSFLARLILSGVAARRRCATQVILCFRGVNVSGFCSRRRASIIYGCLSFHVVVVWVKMSAYIRHVRVCSLVAAYFTACSVFSFGVPYLPWKQRAARILCVIPRRNEQVTYADVVCRNDLVLAKSGHVIPRVGLATTTQQHGLGTLQL